MGVSIGHPLRRLFTDLVERNFGEGVQVRDSHVTSYVSNLLTDFLEVSNLHRVRNVSGEPLEDVGELMAESDPLGPSGSFDRERAVRTHIGDYTLFLAGLFPEYVTSYRRRWKPAPDVMVDYVQTGRESYYIVSCFDQFEYKDEAPVFRRLAEKFELCVYGLHLVKRDLERYQQDYHARLQGMLGNLPSA